MESIGNEGDAVDGCALDVLEDKEKKVDDDANPAFQVSTDLADLAMRCLTGMDKPRQQTIDLAFCPFI